MKRNIVDFLLLTIILTACSAQPIFSANPTVASTTVPLLTPIASTTTFSAPTQTPDVTEVFTPQGKPASDWDGIPIMPGATSGEGDAEGYVFTIQATSQQIKEYYEVELSKLGWQALGTEEGDASLTLIFMNNASGTLTINIAVKGNEALVLLVK